MRITKVLIVIAFCLLVAGCEHSKYAPVRELPFQVYPKAPFRLLDISNHSHQPQAILYASAVEVQPPLGTMFSEPMLEIVRQVDFNHSYLMLISVGTIPENERILGVSRQGNRVLVEMQVNGVGPGNYPLRDWSSPYLIVEIKKVGEWGQKIQFVILQELDGETDVYWEGKHEIP